MMGFPPAVQLEVLLHDCGEAYLPDIARPIKHYFPEAVRMEHAVHEMVRRWVGFDALTPCPTAIIKEMDSRIIRDERAQLMYQSGNVWLVDVFEPLGITIEGWAPQEAKQKFLAYYQMLTMQVFGKPLYLQFDDFGDNSLAAMTGQPIYNDTGKPTPDIRAIDVRGNLALVAHDGKLRYVEGNYEVYIGAGSSFVEAPGT
jgi:hypothetical protein